mmetsp:Transcript_8195/g.21858  ORF Transcript_8195/g.21858 Transcript_8195/m.21858 type:complete len:1248 (+) Transcript_8195:163-3906(+)
MDEDLQDVSEFVQEDTEDDTEEQEELLQAKIQEEHAKFKEEQRRWQAQVRAARPWSAPPLSSPRPESQRLKKHEASEMARSPAAMLLATNRREVYVPPPRAHLLGQPGQGDNRPASADMAHLGPPRPASADTPGVSNRMHHSAGIMSIKNSGLADIQEESPLVTHHDFLNGQGPFAHAGRAESHLSNEDSSHNTSISASPSQPPCSGSNAQHSTLEDALPSAAAHHSPSAPQALSHDEEAHDPSSKPRSLFTLGHEGSEGSSDSSDGDEGDEDLFCLFDRESQALKDNIDAYNSGALHKGQEEPQVKEEDNLRTQHHNEGANVQGEGHPSTQHQIEGASTAPLAPQTGGSPAALTHTPEALCTSPPEQAPKQVELPPDAPSLSPPLEVSPSGTPEAGKVENVKEDCSRHGNSSSSSSSSGKRDRGSTHGDDGKGGEGSIEEEEPVGEGGLLPPHQFALHLMAHDLRTLPAHLGSGSSKRACGTQSKASSPSSPPHPIYLAGTARFAAAGPSFPPNPPHFPDTSHHHRHEPSPLDALPLQADLPRAASTECREAGPAQQSSQGWGAVGKAAGYERAWHHWSPAQLRQHLGFSTRPLSAVAAASQAQHQPGHAQPAAASRRPSSAAAASSSVGRRRGLSAGSSSNTTHRPPYAHPAGDGCAPGKTGGQLSSSSAPDVNGLGEGCIGSAQGGGGLEAEAMGDSVRHEMPTMRTMMEGAAGACHASSNESKEGQAGRPPHVGPSEAHSGSEAGGGSGGGGGSALKYEDWFARMMGEATSGDGAHDPPSRAGEHLWTGFGEEFGNVPAGALGGGPVSSSAAWAGHTSHASSVAASSPGSGSHQQQQVASRQGRDAARPSRPSTAPSSRHANQHTPAHLAQAQGMQFSHPEVTSSPYHVATSPGGLGQRPPRLTRPVSAYAMLRGGGTHGSPPTAYLSSLGEPAPAWDIQTPSTPLTAPQLPQKVDRTAAVNVGKAAVSVYVEDTSRRIMEANRWMASLELRSRYRLRSRLSNMIVQVYDSTWQPQLDPDEDEAESEPQLTNHPEDVAAAAPTTKELTIKQFLALHLRLKAQVKEAAARRLSCRNRMGSPGRRAATASARPKSAAAKSVVASQGGGLHAGPTRQRPMSAHASGGAKLVELSQGARYSDFPGGGYQGKEGDRAKHVPASPNLQLHQKQREALCVSVPHTVQQAGPAGYCFGVKDGFEDRLFIGAAPGSPGKAGSTAQVQEELEGLAIQCKAISRNISLLGGVIC